jgi:Trk K+ transport system NAD-binding subunit
MNNKKKNEINIILGDFNVKVGRGVAEELVAENVVLAIEMTEKTCLKKTRSVLLREGIYHQKYILRFLVT